MVRYSRRVGTPHPDFKCFFNIISGCKIPKKKAKNKWFTQYAILFIRFTYRKAICCETLFVLFLQIHSIFKKKSLYIDCLLPIMKLNQEKNG
jgi:hypothetical protein